MILTESERALYLQQRCIVCGTKRGMARHRYHCRMCSQYRRNPHKPLEMGKPFKVRVR